MTTPVYTVKDYVYEYGHFIILFEKICLNLRWRIKELIVDKFNKENVALLDILLADLTGQPLVEKYVTVFAEKHPTLVDNLKIVKKIRSIFADKLLPLRNDLVHGITVFDWDEETVKLMGMKVIHHKLSSKGLNENLRNFSCDKMIVLNNNVDLFNSAVFLAGYLRPSEYSETVVKANTDMLIKILENVDFRH